jgi:hypothetical protein
MAINVEMMDEPCENGLAASLYIRARLKWIFWVVNCATGLASDEPVDVHP